MAYEIQAVIGPRRSVETFAGRFNAAQVVELSDGFALVPLTDELTREMGEAFQLPLLLGREIPRILDEVCQDASDGGGIAYVECESEAGPFWQASVVWRDGEIVLGPLIDLGLDDDPASRNAGPPTPDRHDQPGWPINRALRELGVIASHEAPWDDEFEVVGLSRHRLTREWAGQE